ncbi:5-oxoprolinase subunit PxpB [Winogradskyella jejuensis]|uniref:Inhibitor of KinA n=1 Tax=Winogradskyella jejuensis TaxID=1089305 RepID=A0A1M5T916_9FLAO|nr:5-oxoprolinase subunit PxpB [Winogradskyella jejuensis]SHH47211.1 inhibitor of KinA [Winogradskyella jejuensis]
MKYNLKYSRFGERSILIEWPQFIDENMLQDILNFKKCIQKLYIEQKVEIINTYNSILISCEFTIENINDEMLHLSSLYSGLNIGDILETRLWEIPVCYNDDFGFDLEAMSIAKSLSKAEIIKRHSEQIYTVFFIGFLPGFLYLGGLDESLHFNRKSTPNLDIKKGAVGIGGNQTGIYPKNSPGGWHIIGQSPIDFFDINSDNPCFAKAGDKVKFQPVSRAIYDEILSEVKSNSFQLKSRIYD